MYGEGTMRVDYIVGHVTVSQQGSVNYIYETTAFDFLAVAECSGNIDRNSNCIILCTTFCINPVKRIDID